MWTVYVKNSRYDPQFFQRKYGTYDTEEEARCVCAKLEAETTKHVILEKELSPVRPS
jgi:hypothetical protein